MIQTMTANEKGDPVRVQPSFIAKGHNAFVDKADMVYAYTSRSEHNEIAGDADGVAELIDPGPRKQKKTKH